MPEILNAWGEPVAPTDPDDGFTVPPEERIDTDEGPLSDAREGGTDMDGWEPE